MPLYNAAYLVISDDAVSADDAVFEFRHDLEVDDRVEKDYLVGNAGSAVQEAIRFVSQYVEELPSPSVGGRRGGLSVDAGGGQHGGTLTMKTGLEDVRWGDASGGTGPSNVTQTDASGAEVNPRARLDVLQYWIAKSLTDLRGQARIHIGEYTDGSYGGATAGAHDQFPVDIISCEARMPIDEPTDTDITLEYRRTQVPNTQLVDDALSWVNNVTDPEWITNEDGIDFEFPDF